MSELDRGVFHTAPRGLHSIPEGRKIFGLHKVALLSQGDVKPVNGIHA